MTSKLPRPLTLPLELRHEIYSHLTAAQPTSYPFPTPFITSVSHRPLSTNLQLTCRALHADLKEYFYATATLTFVAHGGPLSRWEDCDVQTRDAVRCARKVRIRLHWGDGQGGKQDKWLEGLVDVLVRQAAVLEVVELVVSVVGSKWWVDRERLLEPFGRLRGAVEVRVGEASGEDGEEGELRRWLEGVVRELG